MGTVRHWKHFWSTISVHFMASVDISTHSGFQCKR